MRTKPTSCVVGEPEYPTSVAGGSYRPLALALWSFVYASFELRIPLLALVWD